MPVFTEPTPPTRSTGGPAPAADANALAVAVRAMQAAGLLTGPEVQILLAGDLYGVKSSVRTASLSLGPGWAGTVVEMNTTAAAAVNIQNDAIQNYPVGTIIPVTQVGTGQITITAASGVTLQCADVPVLRKQFSSATLRKRAANTWLVEGDLS